MARVSTHPGSIFPVGLTVSLRKVHPLQAYVRMIRLARRLRAISGHSCSVSRHLHTRQGAPRTLTLTVGPSVPGLHESSRSACQGGLRPGSANQIARALISMMARSIELQLEAGYIDARPLSQLDDPSCDARPDHTFGVNTRISAGATRTARIRKLAGTPSVRRRLPASAGFFVGRAIRPRRTVRVGSRRKSGSSGRGVDRRWADHRPPGPPRAGRRPAQVRSRVR